MVERIEKKNAIELIRKAQRNNRKEYMTRPTKSSQLRSLSIKEKLKNNSRQQSVTANVSIASINNDEIYLRKTP